MNQPAAKIRTAALSIALGLALTAGSAGAVPALLAPLASPGADVSEGSHRSGVTPRAGDAASATNGAIADSAAVSDAALARFGSGGLGGLAFEERRSAAPFLAAGIAIGAVAAPAILFGGGWSSGEIATGAGAGAGFHALPEPIVLPTPRGGMIDPPVLDVTPATAGEGPGTESAPAIPEPASAFLLAAGFLALAATMDRRR